MSAAPEQLPLDLVHHPALGRQDFLVSAANAAAAARVMDWKNWTGRRLAVAGPAQSGKTHLVHVWMQDSGAVRVPFRNLDETLAPDLAEAGCVAVEDIDANTDGAPDAAERGLLHLFNLLDAHGGWLMLTGRDAPARWPLALPDLASRVATMEVQRIAPPDDALLSSILVKLFADRQLAVTPEVIRYLVRHMERSFAEAGRLVTKLDRLSLARKRPVTVRMAAVMMGIAEEKGPKS